MPPLPGEELKVTVFADVHYYINAPGSSPPHHRFVRGAYLYFFHNATQRRSRLEIANHAGTPDQDALDGYLDAVSFSHDKKQANLATLTVEGHVASAGPRFPDDPASWRIISYDLRHENKYLYRLHSIDIYFWNTADSSKFVDLCRQLLRPQQLHLTPPDLALGDAARTRDADYGNAVHPVVQQLEQAAIADDYRPRASTVSTVQSSAGGPESIGHTSSRAETPASMPPPPAAYAPYNPASPGVPEAFANREKTPPPVDATAGTGLAQAAMREDQNVQHPIQQQQQPGQQSAPAYPGRVPSLTSIMPPAPYAMPPAGTPSVSAQIPRTPNLFPNTPSSIPPPPFQPSTPITQYATYPQTPRDTPLQSPDYFPQTPLASPGFDPPPMGSPPSNYIYTSSAPQPQTHHSPIHQQFYRPTETEAAHGHIGSHRSLAEAMGYGSPAAGHAKAADPHPEPADGSPAKRKAEARAGRIDRGINRWIKKIDKI